MLRMLVASAATIGSLTLPLSAQCQTTSPAAAPTTESNSVQTTTTSQAATTTSTGTLETQPAALTGTIGSNVDLTVDNKEIIFQGKHGLRVHVRNRTNEPLVFNGNAATVHLNGSVLSAAPSHHVVDKVCPPVTAATEFVHGVIDFATVGMYDTARDAETQSGPVLGRYGCDQLRRETEENRFGQRILWPNDDTEGIVFFETDQTLNGGTIDLPVSAYHAGITTTPTTTQSATAAGANQTAASEAGTGTASPAQTTPPSVPLRPELPPAATPPDVSPSGPATTTPAPINPSL